MKYKLDVNASANDITLTYAGYDMLCDFGKTIGRMPTMEEIFLCVKNRIQNEDKGNMYYWEAILKIDGKELCLMEDYFGEHYIEDLYHEAERIDD